MMIETDFIFKHFYQIALELLPLICEQKSTSEK